MKLKKKSFHIIQSNTLSIYPHCILTEILLSGLCAMGLSKVLDGAPSSRISTLESTAAHSPDNSIAVILHVDGKPVVTNTINLLLVKSSLCLSCNRCESPACCKIYL